MQGFTGWTFDARVALSSQSTILIMEDNTTIFSSVNIHTPCDLEYPWGVALTFAFLAIFVILENVIGILTIYSTPSLHTTANVFVCSMAVTDLAAGLSCLLANTLILASKFEYIPDIVAAYGLMVMLIIFGMVILSCAHMAMIAIERYTYIAHPFFYRRYVSPQTIRRILILFWVLGFVYLITLLTTYFTNVEVSLCSRQMPETWELIISLSIYSISLVISLACYFLICVVICRQKRIRITQQKSIRLDVISGRREERLDCAQKEIIFRETMRTVKFFAWVFFIFTVFTFPPASLFVYDVCCSKIENTVFRIATAPAVLNSVVNFLLLLYFNKQFRDGFKSQLIRLLGLKKARCC